MPKPFDATVKAMLEESPLDWPRLAGYPARAAELIDVDISTFTGATDKVLRVRGAPDWILQIDFQAGPDSSLPRRMHVYNALLEDRHDLPVRSLAVLLRPAADHANLTGVYQRQVGQEPPYLEFRYQVLRAWQVPVEVLLAGGPGTLPLAPISSVREADLPAVIERLKERLLREQTRHQAARLWTATYVLMGLRYPQPLVDRLLQGVIAMEESVTYQAIVARGLAEGLEKGLAKGRLQEARRILLLHGTNRYGSPDRAANAAIETIDNPEQLEQLSLRVQDAGSWQELLGLPPQRGRKRNSR